EGADLEAESALAGVRADERELVLAGAVAVEAGHLHVQAAVLRIDVEVGEDRGAGLAVERRRRLEDEEAVGLARTPAQADEFLVSVAVPVRAARGARPGGLRRPERLVGRECRLHLLVLLLGDRAELERLAAVDPLADEERLVAAVPVRVDRADQDDGAVADGRAEGLLLRAGDLRRR